MDTTTIAEKMEKDLQRLRIARPALDSRISRAEHILVTQLSVSGGTRPVKVRLHADGSRSYRVRSDSRLRRTYTVEPSTWSCDCPNFRSRGKAKPAGCKHAIACYVFDRVVSTATRPSESALPERTGRREPSSRGESLAEARRPAADIMAGLARMTG